MNLLDIMIITRARVSVIVTFCIVLQTEKHLNKYDKFPNK